MKSVKGNKDAKPISPNMMTNDTLSNKDTSKEDTKNTNQDTR